MDKIYLKDNYIVTELSGVTAVFPKNYSSYSENASGFYINSTFPVNNQRAVYIDFTRVASVYNEAGTTAYTIATLRSFLLTNTGFKSPSGGSGGVWGSITGTLSSQTDLQSALNAKENTITAGTTSQYYRGDKTFQTLDKTAVGLGNVDNTSDLNKPISTLTQTALNAKQDTLTLTTTGTSGAATLVGATLNIPQYSGGGGASGLHAPFIVSGGSYSYGVNANLLSSGVSIFNNQMRLVPFKPSETFTCSALYISCTALGAGNLARILIYSNVNNQPNTKLYESANLDLSTTGIKTASTTFTFNAGTTYWICTHTSGSIANLTILPNTAVYPIRIGGVSNPSTYVSSQMAYPIGSAPTTMGIINYNSGSIFYVGITAA